MVAARYREDWEWALLTYTNIFYFQNNFLFVQLYSIYTFLLQQIILISPFCFGFVQICFMIHTNNVLLSIYTFLLPQIIWFPQFYFQNILFDSHKLCLICQKILYDSHKKMIFKIYYLTQTNNFWFVKIYFMIHTNNVLLSIYTFLLPQIIWFPQFFPIGLKGPGGQPACFGAGCYIEMALSYHQPHQHGHFLLQI